MNYKKQAKFKTGSAKVEMVLLFLVCLSALLLFEPNLRSKVIYAVSYFDAAKTASVSQEADNQGKDVKELQQIPQVAHQQKTRAPEPSTLFLLVSGLGSMIVRFARKSFDKFKRASDIVLAIAGLTIVSPLLAFAALLIRLDSKGRIIYQQNRVGLNGKIFKIYKLRSMRIDAEKGTGAVWAKKNDPRITAVGKVLRKTHIDEIPQLINVLKGEMSIVGPRPERPEIVRDLKALIVDYEKRLIIKPGITGLAQVWHKYDETIEDVKKKIKYDLLYARKMCLWVDLRIIGKTFVTVLVGKGAN